MGKLENKVAIITGAGSGLGRAGALLYAREGAKLILCEINPTRLDETLELFKAEGLEAVGMVGDVRNVADAKAAVDKAMELYGKLDILVNCAGIGDSFSPVGEITDEEWDLVLGINLTGTKNFSREAIRVMQPQKSGVIINFSSLCGQTGGRQGCAYVASKWAIIGLTKNTAAMYSLDGIRCNAICPGGVPTNFMKDPDGNKILKNKPYMRKALSGGMVESNARINFEGRLGVPVPDEIATIMLFLASDDAKLVNGHALTADGGWGAY